MTARHVGGVPAADLPDVNVWLALSVLEHPHHARAMAYWQHETAALACFCRVTMLGLVRLLTQPRVMGAGALDTEAAMSVWQRWQQLPEVAMQPEPPSCDASLRSMARPDLPPRLLTDAYLAAHAISGGMRLVTFDADFRRFDGLHLLHLTSENAPA